MSTIQVGPLYGRRMMKAVLEARGVKVAESRIANSLQRVEPVQYEHRRNDTADRLNPSVYVALYFGHKLHVDQNEKLIQFGVTHVIARDGFSGKIVAYATMPVKNNLAIYESIFRYSALVLQIVILVHYNFYLDSHVLQSTNAVCKEGRKHALNN